jgi:glycosyltransferase involved in cell wall biosynthesis
MISNDNKSTPKYPLVTIVALCYNQAKYAEETLDSILAQKYPNIQLIIMDDASYDNSVELINNWI